MTQTQFEARKERAENGALVASKTEDGYRVYSLHNPSNIYLVKQEGERWTCTCPDFEFHKTDTAWRCKHILAVAPWNRKEAAPSPVNAAEAPAEAAAPAEPEKPSARKRKTQEQLVPPVPVHMTMKRSVSPDGRINSVSVEFSIPVSDMTGAEIKTKALTTLQLQRDIVASFLKLNGNTLPEAPARNNPAPAEDGNGKPVFPRMLDIGKVNGKWGKRLCITFQVNDRRCRLFGSANQLATHITSAGYEIDPQAIEEGLRLNLPCRVVTKPTDDGRYLNVEQVLPAAKKLTTGGNHGAAFN